MSTAYEFSEQDNENLTALSRAITLFVIANVLTGALDLITAYFYWSDEKDAVGTIAIAALSLVHFAFGIVWYAPLDNLKKIVTTSGNDIPELMTSIEDMKKAFFASVLVGVAMVVLRVTLTYFV